MRKRWGSYAKIFGKKPCRNVIIIIKPIIIINDDDVWPAPYVDDDDVWPTPLIHTEYTLQIHACIHPVQLPHHN